ncbi:MAG: phosphoadenosine phosphosulfate reductase family protein [Leptospiraceae bacterium]|nr:phosphoadenosine phosphosulfate reductase family protein [Leptospiraceae bacterium]
MNKVRHVLGISGGKDSAALAIYLKAKYPSLDIEYYTCDTGKELKETYQLIDNLENYLGKKITKLRAVENSHEKPFDHYFQLHGGYLPSPLARWCTKKLKLDPFEKFVGNDPVVSYVGIRGDEERDGYISKKSNIQSIFPFRKNIWSEDVINKFLNNANSKEVLHYYKEIVEDELKQKKIIDVVKEPLSLKFNQKRKLNTLLDLGISEFNKVVFAFLKTTDYPLAKEEGFPILDNEEILVQDDIFRILEESGVGIPAYYMPTEFAVNGKKGQYARSRSGCFFCFFQQKIEWVWLYEQHPDLYKEAICYEEGGYKWMQDETLEELIQPSRITKIKEDFLQKSNTIGKPYLNQSASPYLLDILDNGEEGCASCFL